MSIKAIFFSKFDTQEGPKVFHQVPEGSIVPSADINNGAQAEPFFSFRAISSFIIPLQSLCGDLISVVPPPPTAQSPSYLVLGYPICLTSPSYPRNEFIFNFSLVLSATESIDVNAYKSVVTKLAHLMRSLEEQSQFLSSNNSPPGTGKLYSLCEMLMEDLNNYCECMIPIDELNTLNFKLFPTYQPPPAVKAWHVPIFTIRPETLMDENWDLTMQRIIPHVNGISSVKQIALQADADFSLTRRCMKHLLYYGCLLLLDIFSFNAIYAVTAEFPRTIASEPELQRECAQYVNIAFAPTLEPAVQSDLPGSGLSFRRDTDSDDDIWPLTSDNRMVDSVGIVQLFAALRQGQSVREWYAENSNLLANIDLRRFITFGVIKGFLYRVHKYAFATGIARAGAGTNNSPEFTSNRNGVVISHRNGKNGVAIPITSVTGSTAAIATTTNATTTLPRSMSSERYFDESDSGLGDEDGEDDEQLDIDRIANERLAKYLDGAHCFDQICTELEISEKDLTARLKRYPDEVLIIHS